MEPKTKIQAEDGKQEMVITRAFDLPVELLFRAYVEPELVEQWMGTQVLSMESKKHGSYRIETKDAKGNVAFQAGGVIHELSPNRKITRTFEMENTPIGVQLELYEFESLSDQTSKLTMHVLYESVAQRDQVLQWGMRQGLNGAHDRIQNMLTQAK